MLRNRSNVAMACMCLMGGCVAKNISNHAVSMIWFDNCTLQYFGRPSGNNILRPGSALSWSIDLVTATSLGTTTITSANATCEEVAQVGSDGVATRHAVAMPVSKSATITLEVIVTTMLLPDESTSGAGLVSSKLRVRISKGDPTLVSLWKVSSGLSGVRIESPLARQFLPKVIKIQCTH